jgi:hypothetical protein
MTECSSSRRARAISPGSDIDLVLTELPDQPLRLLNVASGGQPCSRPGGW